MERRHIWRRLRNEAARVQAKLDAETLAAEKRA
jgi:hypothetical protein